MANSAEVMTDADMAEAPELNEARSTPGLREQQSVDQHQQPQPQAGQEHDRIEQSSHPHQPRVEDARQTEPEASASAAASAAIAPAALSDSSSHQSPLPVAFPKKRRGRPPGRPNMTVRETDYEDNPLVQAWNAAKGERAVPVVSIGIRAALTEQSLVHETQRAIFRLPSRETIHFVQGWITARHIASQRPSYVNGLLIHSRGHDAPVSCAQCTERRARHALGPFLSCRVLPGSYHNSCSNCKWFDNTSACSLYTGPKPNRKRKAKEQLPQPPPTGILHEDDTNETSPAATHMEGVRETSMRQSHPLSQQEQPHLQPPRPQSQPQHQPQHQPEPDMTPIRHNQQERNSAADHLVDPSIHPRSHNETSGSETAEVPSQADSLTEQHFLLSKSDRGEDSAQATGHDDDFVAAQLAAQLLPEIQRHDS